MWLPRLCRTVAVGDLKQTVSPDVNNLLLRSPMLLTSVEQIRGRKRNLGKALTKQERLERRMRREEKIAEKKKYSFMQRIDNRRMSMLQSPSEQFPGRYDANADAELLELPAQTVYLSDQHRNKFYSIAEALDLHRQLQQSAMYNHPNGALQLRFELNMNTEKATRMVSDSQEIVPVPHTFPHREKRAILAMAVTKENQQLALDSGADTAIGPEMIKKILKGEFNIIDYDFCVAHPEMGSSILPLRGVLRSRFPTASNGALGVDLPQIIQRFLTGVKLSIKCDPIYQHWGISKPIVGLLGMPNEEVEANIAAIVEALCKHRTPALGPFINRTTLSVLPDRTCFAIDVSKYMPVATESDIEKFQSRQKKKKSKKVQELVVEKPDDDSYLLALM